MTERSGPSRRRRAWLVPAAAIGAVAAVLGACGSTSSEDQEPAAAVSDPTVPSPDASPATTPDTSAVTTAGETADGCLQPPFLTLTATGTSGTVETVEMVVDSFGVTSPLDCRLIVEAPDDFADATAATTIISPATSLILDGFPEDGKADGARLRVQYALARYDPLTGPVEALTSGELTVSSKIPVGYATSSDPTLPPTPETFEIPLVDAPCVLVLVVWSLGPDAQGRNIAYVGESLDACLPAP